MRRFIVVSALYVLGCGPSATMGGDGGVGPMDPCVGQVSRCWGSTYQVCVDGQFQDQATCMGAQVCAQDLGCVACDPAWNETCVGDDAYVCNDDGSLGGFLETCPLETCVHGQCGAPMGCAEEGKYIYVVDETYRLLRFDPTMESSLSAFSVIGNLSCPASASWPDWGGVGPATPFSMSVDRTGRAWVLYTSGEIFWVSTDDASCQATGFVKGQQSFQLFGMGFVSDSAGSNAEKLYIAGGPAIDLSTGMSDLAFVDPTSLGITQRGPLATAEYSPELTGTGAAELYAYYPGATNSFVAKIDKMTGQSLQQWPLPGLDQDVMAWAFAHWGGRFYIFVTTTDLFTGSNNSRVLRLDPMTGATVTLQQNLPYIIVGAGVSTCAPIIIE